MKYIAIAALALVGQTQAVRYATSEGPTKVDFGEHEEESTMIREDRFKNGWENPLSWTDDGDRDDVVLTMVDGTLRQGAKSKFIDNSQKITILTTLDGQMRPIYDADGDGVEDNVKKTRDELDAFYDPLVFGVAEEIHNTHHGNLPGHVRKAEYEDSPKGHQGDLVLHI